MKTYFFLVCVLCVSLVHADSRLYHRIWNPSAPAPPFSPRAHVIDSQESVLVLANADSTDQLILDSDQLEGALYQVALERNGDLFTNDWDITSVKACHVVEMTSDTLIIHVSQSQQAYAIDYFVHPVPHDGSCPKKTPGFRSQVSFANTTLIVKTTEKPPIPELRPPPQLSPQGEPIQPQPEQSFIQKYWMYILMGLVTLMVTGGGVSEPEQGDRAQGGSSGGRTAGR